MEDRETPQNRLEGFLRSELSRQENQQIVRRLLAGETDRESVPLEAGPEAFAGRRDGAAPDRYAEIFDRVAHALEDVQSRLLQERRSAPGQWSFLEVHPQPRRQIMIRNDRRLQTWGLYDLLLERSRRLAEPEPAKAVEMAELALTVAGSLDPERYGTERVADFRTAALASLGNARRLAGDLVGARMAFQQARLSLEFGTGDALEEANLSSLLAHLLCDLGEYAKAALALERATALYRRAGDPRVPDLELPQSVREVEERRHRGLG